eukprot:6185098-Pleurochrysis_carterae.AAC.4
MTLRACAWHALAICAKPLGWARALLTILLAAPVLRCLVACWPRPGRPAFVFAGLRGLIAQIAASSLHAGVQQLSCGDYCASGAYRLQSAWEQFPSSA